MPETSPRPVTGLSVFSLIAIVILGVIPIWGLIYFGWGTSQVVALFWVESLIVGVFTWMRVRDTERGQSVDGGLPLLSTRFLVRYGPLWLLQGVLTWVLVLIFLPSGDDGWRGLVENPNFWKAVMGIGLMLTLVHWREWARPQAWRGVEPSLEMFRPYGRVLALHLAMLIGFWIAAIAGAGREFAIALCVIKLALDLGLTLWAAQFRIRFEPLVERS